MMSGVLGIGLVIFGLFHFISRGQASASTTPSPSASPQVASGSTTPAHGQIWKEVFSPSGGVQPEQLPRLTWDFEHDPSSIEGWRNIILDNAKTNVVFRRQNVDGDEVLGPYPFSKRKPTSRTNTWGSAKEEDLDHCHKADNSNDCELTWPESSAAAPVLFRSPPMSLMGNISLEVEFGAGGGPVVDMPAYPSTGNIAYGFMGVALGCQDNLPLHSSPYITWVHRQVEDKNRGDHFQSVRQRNSSIFSLRGTNTPMRNCTVDVIQHYTGRWSWFSVKSVSILTEATAASCTSRLRKWLPLLTVTAYFLMEL